jgi:hypothetical protein
MARAVVNSNPERRPACEPLYDLHPQTGETLEVFFVDRTLARSFGTGSVGFWWWTCRPGGLPSEPHGPFATSYLAYRDAMGGAGRVFGRRANLSSDAQPAKH